MSSGNRFEKTFTRKKKETHKKGNNTNGVKEDEHVLTPSPHESPSHQHNGKSENSNKNNGSHSKPTVVKKGEQSTNKNKTAAKKKEDNDKKKKKKKKNDNDLLKPKQKKEELNVQNERKDETQKKKRKLENGVGEIEKDEVLKKMKKPKTSKSQRKEKEDVKGESSECAFPTNRILRIVKSEGSSDCKLNGEAVFLINKATEKFIELFSNDAYDSAVEDHKSFVGYKHLASAVCKKKRFDFLSDFVPEKVAAEKALAERKPAETLPC